MNQALKTGIHNKTNATPESLRSILTAAEELTDDDRQELETSFLVLDPIAFARKIIPLMDTGTPDKLWSDLLSLRVMAPDLVAPDDGVEAALASAMERFWERLYAHVAAQTAAQERKS